MTEGQISHWEPPPLSSTYSNIKAKPGIILYLPHEVSPQPPMPKSDSETYFEKYRCRLHSLLCALCLCYSKYGLGTIYILITRSRVELQNLRLPIGLTKAESTFYQDSQVMHMNIWISIIGEVAFEESGSTGQIWRKWLEGRVVRHQSFPRNEATEVMCDNN